MPQLDKKRLDLIDKILPKKKKKKYNYPVLETSIMN